MQVYISDKSLKEAENNKTELLFREKNAVARCCDNFGADFIELPQIKNYKEDYIIFKTICENVKNAGVVIPVGFSENGIEEAFSCIKNAKKPCLQIEAPVSTVQMEYLYHLKGDKMLIKLQALIKKAREICPEVEFCALDASRADRDFLLSVLSVAAGSGCARVTVSDSAGLWLPNDVEELIKEIKKNIKVPVFVEVNDALSLAAANALSAVMAGAEGVKTSVFGKKTLITDTFSKILITKGKDLGLTSSLKDTEIHTDIKEILKFVSSKPKEAESHSGGEDIYLSEESTLSELKKAVKKLGYELTNEDCGFVHSAVKQLCVKKDSIGAKELEAVIATYAMQAPSTYHLVDYVTTTGSLTGSVSKITLTREDKTIIGVASGEGPIDSCFKAIEKAVGHNYELDDFQIQAVTQGKEALGSAIVKLRNNGRLYSGNGVSPDIVSAGVRAYINALNKILND